MVVNDTKIVCPACKVEIKLNDQLAAPLLAAAKRDFDKKLADQESAFDAERLKIAEQELLRAKKITALKFEAKEKELADLTELSGQQQEKLLEAQKAQTDYLKKQRLIDNEKRELDLTIEKRVQESLLTIREMAKKEVENELNLKVAEKELIISQMNTKIEELKRKSEQGSHQIQGEVLELHIENILKTKFRDDQFEPITKGVQGGDCIQKIMSISKPCGSIQWEAKRTIAWSDKWLEKAREDQRNANADVAVIVSKTLPKGMDISSFDFIEGVWVTSPQYVIPVAVVLRQCLVEINAIRKTGEGQQTKMAMMYDYLIGSGFRRRVEAIVEKFSAMQEDLFRERKAIKKIWAKREKDLSIAIESTAGMYGDLQSILGAASLMEIEGLNISLLELEDEFGD